jgi:hypothetical protein
MICFIRSLVRYLFRSRQVIRKVKVVVVVVVVVVCGDALRMLVMAQMAC